MGGEVGTGAGLVVGMMSLTRFRLSPRASFYSCVKSLVPNGEEHFLSHVGNLSTILVGRAKRKRAARRKSRFLRGGSWAVADGNVDA